MQKSVVARREIVGGVAGLPGAERLELERPGGSEGFLIWSAIVRHRYLTTTGKEGHLMGFGPVVGHLEGHNAGGHLDLGRVE
jgi:hypothetical protein